MLRRFPAVLWLPVYVGSLLILNGAHGKSDALQLVLGIGLAFIAWCIALYLAVGRWRDTQPPDRGLLWLIGGVAAFYVVSAVAAAVFAGTGAGIATALAGIIPMTAAAIVVATTRAKSAAPDAALEDHTDPTPGIPADDVRPLGDTPEAHDEIVPEDLPRDHPGRKAAEAQAAARDGTTPGHGEGGAAGQGGRDSERAGETVPRYEKDGARAKR
jgi:hypothetical protein